MLNIRSAKSNEFDLVLNFLREGALWLKEQKIDYWQGRLDTPDGLKNRCKDGFDAGYFYFVEEDGSICGMFRLQYEDKMFWGELDKKAGYIHSFTTKRSLVGKGLGYRILQMVEERLKKENINILRLDCGSNVVGLCKYYEGYGFKKIKEVEVYGDKITLYEKELLSQQISF